MQLIVNGQKQNCEAETLAQLVAALGFAGKPFAAAVNRRFVPRQSYEQTALVDGDEIEILSPMQGG